MSARAEDKTYLDAIAEQSREAMELSRKNSADIAGLVESTRNLAETVLGLSTTVYGDADRPGIKGRLALAEVTIAACTEADQHPPEDRRVWAIWGVLRDVALPVVLSVATALLVVHFS